MFERIADAVSEGRSPYLFTVIEGDNAGKTAMRDGCCIYGDTSALKAIEANTDLPCLIGDVFCERITTPPHLILCGAGHVSVFTARVAKMVGFKVTVIDERTDFANRDRFPDADEIINLPYPEALDAIFDANAYYVIVTRGHQFDRSCLEIILNKPYTYCGMIGSRSKIDIVNAYLANHGYTAEQLKTVHAPIGLSIGAQTPEEIAVCIVGEMIEVKNGARRGSEWDAALCEAIRSASEPYAMVTLIDKKGSAPRASGARMIVFGDGRIVSSIGGGFGEFEAAEHAKRMLTYGPKQKRYTCRMNNTDAAQKGMICGGEIDIFIQIVEV